MLLLSYKNWWPNFNKSFLSLVKEAGMVLLNLNDIQLMRLFIMLLLSPKNQHSHSCTY